MMMLRFYPGHIHELPPAILQLPPTIRNRLLRRLIEPQDER
jgi:hypothetical protein